MRLRAVNVSLNIGYRGPTRLPCHAVHNEGDAMGWFSHGSTILVFAPPDSLLCEAVLTDQQIRMGETLTDNPGGLSQNGHLDCT